MRARSLLRVTRLTAATNTDGRVEAPPVSLTLTLTLTDLEGGEEARLATAHVVRLALRLKRFAVLAPALEEADGAEDLQLGGGGQSVPLRRRAARGGDVGVRDAARGQIPREVDAVRLHDEANERRHRHAAVLSRAGYRVQGSGSG